MKAIFILLFFLVSVSLLNAQRTSWGIKAGANITNFSGDNFENVEKKALVGFHGGIFVSIRLGQIYLQPEVFVSTAGAKFENADSSFKLIYLSIPVILKYRTAIGLYFEVGPQVGFKLSENVSNQTVANLAKNLDFSGVGGIGLQTKKGLGIYGRYVAGLSKVGDFAETQTVDPDFKNSIIQVGVTIPLNK
jgi:hypothetical protein